jgi:hypothetical protein
MVKKLVKKEPSIHPASWPEWVGDTPQILVNKRLKELVAPGHADLFWPAGGRDLGKTGKLLGRLEGMVQNEFGKRGVPKPGSVDDERLLGRLDANADAGFLPCGLAGI